MGWTQPVNRPLAVWDVHDEGWLSDTFREKTAWAQEHFPYRATRTWRAEFYLIDAPFAVLYNYAETPTGSRFTDADSGEAAQEEPHTVMLRELPPKHLLGA